MTADLVPIYLLPGMTSDFPVYSRLLPLLPNASVVDFLPPEPRETLVNYSRRMAKLLPKDAFIGGISFGGIIALEVSRILRPRGCILISSIRHPRELPPWFRIWRPFGGSPSSAVLRMIGGAASLVPRSARTASMARATKLKGDRGNWHHWATSAVLDWKPKPLGDFCPILQIHGTADTTFPIRYVRPDVSITGGSHALPLSHPDQVAAAIRLFVETGKFDNGTDARST